MKKEVIGKFKTNTIYSLNSLKDGDYEVVVTGLLMKEKFTYVGCDDFVFYTNNDILADAALISYYSGDKLKFNLKQNGQYKDVKLNR